jgi:hypothetical protein
MERKLLDCLNNDEHDDYDILYSLSNIVKSSKISETSQISYELNSIVYDATHIKDNYWKVSYINTNFQTRILKYSVVNFNRGTKGFTDKENLIENIKIKCFKNKYVQNNIKRNKLSNKTCKCISIDLQNNSYKEYNIIIKKCNHEKCIFKNKKYIQKSFVVFTNYFYTTHDIQIGDNIYEYITPIAIKCNLKVLSTNLIMIKNNTRYLNISKCNDKERSYIIYSIYYDQFINVTVSDQKSDDLKYILLYANQKYEKLTFGLIMDKDRCFYNEFDLKY